MDDQKQTTITEAQYAALYAELGKLRQDLLRQSLLTKPFLTADEAAQYLNMSLSTFYKHVSAGRIKSHKPNGKRLYISRESLDAFVYGIPRQTE